MTQKNIDYAILGFGKTGIALCDHLLKQGHRVTVIDQQNIDQKVEHYINHPDFNLIAPLNSQIDLDQFDYVIPSPGFRIKPELFGGSLNNIISELDYCAPYFKECHTIAITGTNGKTTWVKLLTHLLEHQGRSVFLGGNVGTPMVEILKGHYDTVILELSSFQLHYSKNYSFDTGIILNIADDHLTWHDTRREYLEAKLALLAHTTGDRYCHSSIKKYIDEHQIKTDLPDQLNWFDQHNLDHHLLSQLDRDKAILGENLVPLIQIFLKQYTKEALITGINSFIPEPYRLNLVVYNDITFINDSKSTNIDSLCFAIRGFPESILILSGDDKKLDYAPCLEAVQKHNMKQILGFGEMGKKLTGYFPEIFNYQYFSDLEPLLIDLKDRLIPGDTVLFSPGSSSFDRYRNYIHRGESFDALVKQIFGGV